MQLLRYLLLLEREADLEILPGLPVSWLKPADRLVALSLPTHFGPTTVKLNIDETGTRGTLWIETPAPENPVGVARLQLGRLHEAGY